MDPQKSSISLSLSVPQGPQPVHVAVKLLRVEGQDICTTVLLCGEGKFLWENGETTFLLVSTEQDNGSRVLTWNARKSFNRKEALRRGCDQRRLLRSELGKNERLARLVAASRKFGFV